MKPWGNVPADFVDKDVMKIFTKKGVLSQFSHY